MNLGLGCGFLCGKGRGAAWWDVTQLLPVPSPVPLSHSTGSTGSVGRVGDFATDHVKTVLAVIGRSRGCAQHRKQHQQANTNLVCPYCASEIPLNDSGN